MSTVALLSLEANGGHALQLVETKTSRKTQQELISKRRTSHHVLSPEYQNRSRIFASLMCISDLALACSIFTLRKYNRIAKSRRNQLVVQVDQSLDGDVIGGEVKPGQGPQLHIQEFTRSCGSEHVTRTSSGLAPRLNVYSFFLKHTTISWIVQSLLIFSLFNTKLFLSVTLSVPLPDASAFDVEMTTW